MSNVKCFSCQNQFDKVTYIPLILPCGHSRLCSHCLWFHSECADINCSEKVPEDTKNLKTNLTVLRLSKDGDNFAVYSGNCLTANVNGIKKNLSDVLGTLEKMKKKVDALDLAGGNNRRDQIIIEPLRALDSIKENLQAIERSLHFGRNTDGSIDIKHYSNDQEILLSRLRSKLAAGEKIYAAGMVKEQMEFGKVYLNGNGLFINSLSITERDDNSSYFWLCDFRSLFEDKICSFFVLPCFGVTSDWKFYTMVFDITKNNRKSGFLEMCTGEAGATFKDSSYYKDGEIFQINLKASDMKINCGAESLEIYDEENVVISYISDSTWEIKKVKNNNYPAALVLERVIARLIDDMEFSLLFSSEPGHRVVLESGIAVFKEPINNFKDIKSNQIQKDLPKSNLIQKDSPKSNQIKKKTLESNQIKKAPKSKEIKK